ncbi:DHH family phosphoesterase [Candidatus Woesearchaeota archaeon]|nr:DHH family phosphoesterase [Candidatus Woesearchaeota archaeon]
MDSYELLKEDTKKAVDFFNSFDKNAPIRLISHLDADGISAASLMVKCLNNANRRYSISIVQQLNKEVLEQVALEPYKYVIFTDIGAGMLDSIKAVLKGKEVLVLDHHDPELTQDGENVFMLNPHKFGIDGGIEVSGAGVVYLFASCLDERIKDYAHIAIIGAIGDLQESGGFSKINREILAEAVSRGKLKVIKGLRLFGAQTKPLHKVLEYCTDPYIPGVSGSESGAIQFLSSLGIYPKNGKGWKKVGHLTEEEMQRLVAGVIMKRLNEKDPEDVLGNVYILKEESHESPTKDAREFATLLNACGRMGKASLGIGVCLGDEKMKERALKSMLEYKKQIVNAMRWYESKKDSEFVTKGKGFMIINAQNEVMHTIIGTLASILSKSNELPDNTYILSMAKLVDGNSKVSIRKSGRNNEEDLKGVMGRIVAGIEGCEAGGHQNAAGALVPMDREEEFVARAKEILASLAMEEKVV